VTLARPTKETIGWSAAALLVVGLLGWWGFLYLGYAMHTRLDFDDAYMFYRYALHMREGLGVSWNPDGVHTYGQTAPLWGLVVAGLSYLPLGMGEVLKMGSGASSILATVAIAWATAANATSPAIRRLAIVYPLVLLPMMYSGMYAGNATNGMETMLAAALAALYLGAVLRWQRGLLRPEFAALAGFLLFLTRPEAALAVVLLPPLAFWLLPGAATCRGLVTRKGLAALLGLFVAAVLVEMLFCKLYFGAPLPLSFYMKSKHGYAGYAANWHPVTLAYLFLIEYRWYLAALVLFARRTEWRLVAVCLAPALVTFAYLLTVTQIMGFDSRYYMPYLAFLVVPALLVVDRRLAEWGGAARSQWSPRKTVVHTLMAAALLLCCVWRVPAGVARVLDRQLMKGKIAYAPVVLVTEGGRKLPEVSYLDAMWAVTETLVAPLPPGAKIAASEVGYLGAHAPRATIIDTAGLNDTEIALHGFSMAALLARQPDIIWMPHPDYTYQRGLMLSAPALLEQYDVYAGAANYGLAVRKDSPYRALLLQQMQALWTRLYPGLRMSDDLVRSVQWSGQSHKLEG
jgi:hypothetical protein